MDIEFDDILLDNYNIDSFEEAQPNKSDDDNANNEAETSGTKRQTKQKFDANLLLEPKGLPLLKSESQHLKFSKKKGQEDQDLKKLMTYYTIWANNLYPGLLMKDFSRRVLTPAKNKAVKNMMDQWSNEYRDRRQIRLDVRNELSGRTVGDEEASDENQPVPADDESSEDDNRPLFFPVTSINTSRAVDAQAKQANSKPKSKPKSNAISKPRTKAVIDSDVEEEEDDDDEDDEQPLFTPSQQQNKRKIVFDDSSEDEDTYKMSRSNALALIIERKKNREQAQRKEQEKALQTSEIPVQTAVGEEEEEEEEEEEIAL
ncbi:hypothetical protein BD408DRAFT_448351 [Parasitella parasitica]|nr:hypothetical protein BD408DRAFT_448351 [Parasitella parasitica]